MINKNIKRVLALVMAMLMTLCSCGCETWTNFKNAFIDPPEEPEHVIKIGVFEPLTGRKLYDAKDEIAGIELAHSLYNSANGYKIELVYEDNHSSESECASAAQRLVNAGCSVVLGSVSDVLSLAGSDVFKENKLPAISATNTVPILTQTNYYYFRTSYINTFDASGAAAYAYNELKADKVAIFYQENSDFAKNESEQFEKNFVELVGKESFEYQEKSLNKETQEIEIKTLESPTVKYVAIDGTESDLAIKDIFTVLAKLGYSTIFCPCDSALALKYISFADSFSKDLTKNNTVTENNTVDDENSSPTESENPDEQQEATPDDQTKIKGFFWIGTDDWQDMLTVASSTYANISFLANTAYTADFDANQSESEISQIFAKEYKKLYGEDSVPSDAVALGFDAYLLAYNAILACQTDETTGEVLTKSEIDSKLFDENGVFSRIGIANSLYKIIDLQAVTGTISIDDNGDPAKDLYIRKFDGKEYNVVYTVHPSLVSKESIE